MITNQDVKLINEYHNKKNIRNYVYLGVSNKLKTEEMSIYNISETGVIEEVQRTSFQENGILERNNLQAYLRDKIDVISPDTLVISE